MSWYTEDLPPSPPAKTAWLAPARARPAGAVPHAYRRWQPPAWPGRGSDEVTAPAAGRDLVPLAFDEADLARVAAAVTTEAMLRTRAACADDAATVRTGAVARLADALETSLRQRRADEVAALGQVVDLAEAIGRALAADGQEWAMLVAAIRSMLGAATTEPAVRLVVGPDAESMVRTGLTDIAASCGFGGAIEIAVDPRLPAGGVQLEWPGSWLEHAPEAIRQRVDTILAAHRSPVARAAARPEHAIAAEQPDGDDDADA